MHLLKFEFEVVTQHAPHSGLVVCVSAPELSEGFNVVRVYFNDRTEALGCGITPYRRTHDRVSLGEEVRVAFSEVVQPRMSDRARAALDVLGDAPVRFAELRDAFRRKVGKSTPAGLIATAVEELEWLRFAAIHPREADPDRWVVTRGRQ